ncbi:MAG TPA: dethiobiotin synthase [Nitrospirae bacterium]|nr:ATP-dependent dethiobiotin synthetase BioD [bacterium BMS3Abin06]HDH12411.1 dethiobiotin synthase [Nitrospirota bacterium]HDY99843.1 dethiobiotin synthase [Nitrospirota bacterium]
MNKGIFITGTDTGTGKTFVAKGLIKAMREKGLNVCPMKPVETGCRIKNGELIPEDTVKLIKASGVTEPIDLINPYRLNHPLAPSVAAEIEGVKISRKKIFSAYKKLSKKYDLMIVEGAGGIMAPVYKKYLFLDLAKDLNLPVVIVSRPGLGTINHSLLTIEAARNKGLNVLGVIINYALKTKKGLPEKTVPEVIEKLGGVPLLGVVPYTKKHGNSRPIKIFNRIVSLLQKQIVSV